MSTPSPLLNAVIAFSNERDLPARKNIVERDRELLLSDEADAVLKAAIARNAQHPDKQELLLESRELLAECRAIGIDPAFVLLLGPVPGLLDVLKDLLAADSGTDAYRITVEHQQLLLTDEADWVLAAMAHDAPELAERIAHRRGLLARCRSEGIEPAFAAMLRHDRTTEALQALARAIGSPQAAQKVLSHYLDVLLTDEALHDLESLAAAPELSRDVHRVFDATHNLLVIARTDGIETACATYLFPRFERLLFRCFFARAKAAQEDPGRSFGINEILETQVEEIDQDFAKKVGAWSEAEMQEDPQVDRLRTYASGLFHLARAFGDLRKGAPQVNTQAATACFQTANRFVQKVSELSQRRTRKEVVFDSVEAAVAAAKRMQIEGGYDLFRGQRRCWPVISTFRRLDPQQQSKAQSRANQFVNWSQQEPALLQYGFSSDQAIAIAQHYGIPTTFLDFSNDIDIARHFATEPDDTPAAGQSELSCIVAIRSAHIQAWIADRFQRVDEFLGSQLLRLDVPNLWRLELQSGAFLVDSPLLDDYPFDYLVFPAPPPAEQARDRSRVYPEERSDLEVVLEQWFLHEKATFGTRVVMDQFRDAGIHFNVVSDGPTDGIGWKGIVRPEPHTSWTEDKSTWLRATERFETARTRPDHVLQVALSPGMDLDKVRSLVAALIPLNSLAELRTRSVTWRLVVDNSVNDATSKKLERQWDALRIDGYSDAQLLESFTMSISLAALQLGLIAGWPGFGASFGRGQTAEPLRTLFGCDFAVEYRGLVGYARGAVGAAALQSAVRDDIDSYLRTNFYEHCGPTLVDRMEHLLTGIHRPSLLFDFRRFVDVYVSQVIPTSAIFRADLPLYPVLHLNSFGVA